MDQPSRCSIRGTGVGSPSKFKFSFFVKLDDAIYLYPPGFNRCFSVHGIFKLLETIPAEEVTPPVAIHALKKIIDLENHVTFRNPGTSPPNVVVEPKQPSFRGSITGVRKSGSDLGEGNETFLRIAFINMLLDIVYRFVCEISN